MSEALFYHPAVLRVIRAVLVSKGIRDKHDREDAIHTAVLACIEHVRCTGQPPKNVAEAIAIARPVARAHGVDQARQRIVRGTTNVGPTGEADEHPQELAPSLDPVDQSRMLAAIRGVLAEEQIEVLADVGAGATQRELGAESHASAPVTRKRVQRTRERARGALGARGYLVPGGFAALLAGVALYFGLRTGSDVETKGPPSDRERAAEERRKAAGACAERQWDECEKALARAAQLDKGGDRAAEVAALRASIAAARRGQGGAGAGDAGRGP